MIMKKYIKMKPVGGILITLLTALPLYAQDNNEIVGQNTPAALERMNIRLMLPVQYWIILYATVQLVWDMISGTVRSGARRKEKG